MDLLFTKRRKKLCEENIVAVNKAFSACREECADLRWEKMFPELKVLESAIEGFFKTVLERITDDSQLM